MIADPSHTAIIDRAIRRAMETNSIRAFALPGGLRAVAVPRTGSADCNWWIDTGPQSNAPLNIVAIGTRYALQEGR